MKRVRLRIIAAFVVFSATFDLSVAATCTVDGSGRIGDCKFITECPEVLNAYQKLNQKPTICDQRLRHICCPHKVTATTPTPTRTTTTAPRPQSRVNIRKCHEYGQYVYENTTIGGLLPTDKPVFKTISKCKQEVVSLIVGGEEAKEREFPHMAIIGFGAGKEEDYQCGGSLISEQWILSAAHCKQAGGQTANFAKLGNVIRNRENQPNVWTYRIVERIVHPDYSSRYADDDIILFKLAQPAKLSAFVIPICLPNKDILTTKSAIATGWGRIGYAEDVSNKLMKVIIDYFDPRNCTEIFEDSNKLANRQVVADKMVCAGSTNKTGDTCNGDSGGPLQVFSSDVYCMYSIIGITSFGSAYCGFEGVPAIYTKVYYYLDWIEKIVWPGE